MRVLVGNTTARSGLDLCSLLVITLKLGLLVGATSAASLRLYAQGANVGKVPGRVVYKGVKGKRGESVGVDDAGIIAINSKTGIGPSTRSGKDGIYTITQASTDAENLVITADKEEDGAYYSGVTTVHYPKPDGSKGASLIELKKQATARLTAPGLSSVIVLTAIKIPPDALTVQSGPSNEISITIKGADDRSLGNVRVTLIRAAREASPNELIYNKVRGDLKSGDKPIIIPIPSEGNYHLVVFADGYDPFNLLVVKRGNNLFGFQADGQPVNFRNTVIVQLVRSLPGERLPEVLTDENEAARRETFLPATMQSLPVLGLRSFDSFALLAPGVAPPPQSANTAGPGVSPGVGTAGQFSVNGLRSRENNFTVDGSDNNDEDIGVRRQGFVGLVPQSIESLQEFQIITLLADARFGRNAGGQVNALSKGGSVNFHGTVYGFLSDHRLNARNFFDHRAGPSSVTLTRSGTASPILFDGRPLVVSNPATDDNPFTRTQTGAAIGGPFPRIRNTYFFASVEKQIIHASQESHFAVPTVKQRGVFDSGETGFIRVPPGQNIFPASVPGDALFSLYPFPNDPSGPYGANTYTTVLPADGHGLRLSGKLDHDFQGNSKPHQGPWWKALFTTYKSYGDRITGRYNLTDERSILPETGGGLFSSLQPKVRTQNLAFFLNRVLNNTAADTVRLSFGRTRLFFGEVRSPTMLPSSALPGTRFLLNAPLSLNLTLPTSPQTTYASASSALGMATLNAMGYSGVTQTEQITGPIGQVVIAGFSPLGVDTENFPQERANNTFQIADTITWNRHKNIYTFGTDIRKTQINSTLDRNFRPKVVMNGLNFDPTFLPGLLGPGGVPLNTSVLSGTTLAAGGVPTGLFQTIAADPNSSIGIRFSQVDLFFQYDRRLTSNLRLNLGVRYELNTVPDTVGHRLENAFDPALLKRQAEEALGVCNPVDPKRCDDLVGALTAAFPADFKVSFGSDRNDFNGRVGFAWVPNSLLNRERGLVIRGGFGSYSGQFPGIVIDQSRNAFGSFVPLNYANLSARSPSTDKMFLFNLASPAVQQLLLAVNPQLQIIKPGTLNTFSGANPISLLANSLFNLSSLSINSSPLGLDLILPQKQLKAPYSFQYGLTVEYQFKHNYLVSVAYAGTHGVKLLRVSTPDLGTNRSFFSFLKVSQLSPQAPFPFFDGRVLPPQPIISKSFTIARTFFESSATSGYNSLQIELRKRYHGIFEFGSAFTYSHAIDDVSDFFDTTGAFALPQDSLRRSEKGSANFDVRLRSTTHFIIDLPKPRFLGRLQIAGIITAQSGQPYTVNSAIDVNEDGNLTDRLNTTSGLITHPSNTGGRVQLQLAPGTDPLTLLARDGFDGAVGRNTFRAPGLITCDLALTETVTSLRIPRLGENQKLLFRAEIFNLFNRANFGIPVRILEAPGFGNSTGTSTPPRSVQLALKLQF